MSIRPLDLQQVVMRSTDVGRDVSAEQTAAASEHVQTADQTKRQARQAETVQQFEEAGAVLVRERQAQPDQQQQEKHGRKQPEPEEEVSVLDEASGSGTPPSPLGRHIDLQI